VKGVPHKNIVQRVSGEEEMATMQPRAHAKTGLDARLAHWGKSASMPFFENLPRGRRKDETFVRRDSMTGGEIHFEIGVSL